MPFTYALPEPTARVRLLIADTDADTAIFQDEEIDVFLDLSDGDVYGAAAGALEAILADKARLAKRVKVGGYETDTQALVYLESLIKRYRLQSAEGRAGLGSLEPTPEHLDYFA